MKPSLKFISSSLQGVWLLWVIVGHTLYPIFFCQALILQYLQLLLVANQLHELVDCYHSFSFGNLEPHTNPVPRTPSNRVALLPLNGQLRLPLAVCPHYPW